MNLKLKTDFSREIRKLRALYNGAKYAFPEISKQIKKETYSKEKEENSKSVYLNDIEEDQFYLAGNSWELANKFKSGYYKTIRELTIIRAISALEVLQVELVKDIFLNKKYLFHTGNKIEFSHSELLSSKSISKIWSKVINKECRRLQNQGFEEIQKYYKKTFSIDFNTFEVHPKDVQYIHEIRHLLVHRLGKTDKQFRHKHNSKLKFISLTDDLFYNYLNKIEKFGLQVIDKANDLIDSEETSLLADKFDTKCFLVVELLSSDSLNFLEPDFAFLSDENIYLLKEILESYNRNDEEIKMNIFCDKAVIKDYLKFIRMSEKNGDIKILQKDIVYFPKITKDEIEKVRAELPNDKPYPIDIHKVIAEKLNVKQRKVYKIIERIINNV